MLNLKHIIYNLPSPVIVVDARRRVKLSNRMAQNMSGMSATQLFEKRGGDVLGCRHAQTHEDGCGYSRHCHSCEAKNAVVGCFETKNNIEPFDMVLESISDGLRDLRLTVTYLPPVESLLTRVTYPALAIVTVEDMTAFKRREKLAAAVETIGAICHEISQPLMVGSGQLELLGMEIGENSRLVVLRDQLKRIEQITAKLRRVKAYQVKPYAAGAEILDIDVASRHLRKPPQGSKKRLQSKK